MAGWKVWTEDNPSIGNTPSNYFDENNSHQGTFTGYYFRKFIDPQLFPGGADKNGTNAILLRLGEIYLNYAEASNELNGPSTEVYNKINMLRQRAGIPDLPPGLSKDELRTEYKTKEGWSLPLKGNAILILSDGTLDRKSSMHIHGMKIYMDNGTQVFERVQHTVVHGSLLRQEITCFQSLQRPWIKIRS